MSWFVSVGGVSAVFSRRGAAVAWGSARFVRGAVVSVSVDWGLPGLGVLPAPRAEAEIRGELPSLGFA